MSATEQKITRRYRIWLMTVWWRTSYQVSVSIFGFKKLANRGGLLFTALDFWPSYTVEKTLRRLLNIHPKNQSLHFLHKRFPTTYSNIIEMHLKTEIAKKALYGRLFFCVADRDEYWKSWWRMKIPVTGAHFLIENQSAKFGAVDNWRNGTAAFLCWRSVNWILLPVARR